MFLIDTTDCHYPPSEKEEMLSKIQKRKASCFDIDLTHYYNSPNGDQGEVGACFGFGAAGLLNNALATII